MNLDAATEHAEQCYPSEAGGLWLSRHDGTTEYRPAKVSKIKDHWAIPPQDWLAAERDGSILGFFHSHPDWPPVPSPLDRVSIDAWGKPWIIMSLPSKEWVRVEPTAPTNPLLGREFVSGVTDCYGIIRDYYARLGVVLPDYHRDWDWWSTKGCSLYLDNCEAAGFYQVPHEELTLHDMVLMNYGSRYGTPNHGAVYVGGNQILQHFFKKQSARSPYGQQYRNMTTHVMRHRDL